MEQVLLNFISGIVGIVIGASTVWVAIRGRIVADLEAVRQALKDEVERLEKELAKERRERLADGARWECEHKKWEKERRELLRRIGELEDELLIWRQRWNDEKK